MKKILVIGGTQFIGRTLVEQLIELNQYDLTLFNRGKTNPDIFPTVKRIRGDRRTDDIQKITQQNWDVILDICGFFPKYLDDLLDKLEGKVGRYVYVSTCSHYQFDEEKSTPLKEDYPLVACSEAEKTDTTGATYNQRKAECERVLHSKTWLDKIILRPGLVIGKYDYTDRLYYWFHKVQTQDRFIIPNHGKNVICYSDVGDLARMLAQSIDVENNFDTYNATSYIASIGDFVNGMMQQTNKSPQLINATPAFLETHEVAEWTEMPLWANGDYLNTDNSRIVQDYNFTCTDIEDTIRSLIDYYGNTLKWRSPKTPGLSINKEQKLMQLMTENDSRFSTENSLKTV